MLVVFKILLKLLWMLHNDNVTRLVTVETRLTGDKLSLEVSEKLQSTFPRIFGRQFVVRTFAEFSFSKMFFLFFWIRFRVLAGYIAQSLSLHRFASALHLALRGLINNILADPWNASSLPLGNAVSLILWERTVCMVYSSVAIAPSLCKCFALGPAGLN